MPVREIPIPLAARIASVTTGSNASLFATNFVSGGLHMFSTLRVFCAMSAGSILTAVYSDGTNTKEIDLNSGASLVASAGYWWAIPLPGSGMFVSGATTATAGLNFKFRDNTASAATYTIILDEVEKAVI